MFNTIKSKIAIITVFMLAVLGIVLAIFSFVVYKTGKEILIINNSFATDSFEGELESSVNNIEKNALDLALLGEIYYKTGKSDEISNYIVKKIFDNYKGSLGGGIWLRPEYTPENKLSCVYAYRDENEGIIIDKTFQTREYNYPQKNWYKEILSKLTKENNIAWSTPYYENEGSSTVMVTAGSGIYDGDKLIGISTVDWEISSIMELVSEIHPTKNSFALFADKIHDYILVSNDTKFGNKELMGRPLTSLPWYRANIKDMSSVSIMNKKFITYVKNLANGMVLIVVVPESELFYVVLKYTMTLFLTLLFVSFLISLLLYFVLRSNIITPIDKLIHIANKISKGEDAEIKLKKPQEFVELADTFDKMKNDIALIAHDREKIVSELQIAKNIQFSSLPNVFPPYPERSEFDIFANMETAKEVGGDFYDFYFIDSNNLMFLVADVSGKGMPAALFMMIVKTLVNNISQTGYSTKELIEQINRKICENNKHGLFVTMQIGIVNIRNSKLTLINCGHNPPLLMKKGSDFEYLELEPNIVLGIFKNADFEIYQTKLSRGDKIFMYTDGVTEAMNKNSELYGEERLKKALDINKNEELKTIVQNLKKDVKDFSKEVEQTDDMTMLVFEYKGVERSTYNNTATKENYGIFKSWLDENIKSYSQELQNKITLCAEEIYTNIMSYAYPDTLGKIEVTFDKTDDSIILRFIDDGVYYNPLEKDDPDINLSALDRKIGGLGIFIVKQSASNVNYQNKNGRNILTLEFLC